ncbi:MAG: GGDEF domain-containing phosphodiesterase [Rubrivivax sp.]|nr:GGDEF domain-containing phosphodiesterase [Rubrivivax sp.]
MRDADLAMYEAKAAGRGRIASFDSSMHERVAEKLVLESDLRHAIGEGQLSVHFQPLHQLQPYRIVGFEALTRWIRPQRGPISPAVFITLAEETGHIAALTSWVIEHSVAQLALWRRSEPVMAHLSMHVNISGRDLARPEFTAYVQQVLQRHGLPASQLTLEITETTLMSHLVAALKTLHELRATGVQFSIDDFNTGYSSLAYLSTLPISSLKIDRSFVIGLNEKPENVEIVRAVLNLGRSLGHQVIAEGIETAEQLATLRSLGVPVGQGYLLSRPLCADQVPALLSLAKTVAA